MEVSRRVEALYLGFPDPLLCCGLPGQPWIQGQARLGGEGMKKRQRCTKKLGSDGSGSLMENHGAPEAQCICESRLDRDVALLYTDKQGGWEVARN